MTVTGRQSGRVVSSPCAVEREAGAVVWAGNSGSKNSSSTNGAGAGLRGDRPRRAGFRLEQEEEEILRTVWEWEVLWPPGILRSSGHKRKDL